LHCNALTQTVAEACVCCAVLVVGAVGIVVAARFTRTIHAYAVAQIARAALFENLALGYAGPGFAKTRTPGYHTDPHTLGPIFQTVAISRHAPVLNAKAVIAHEYALRPVPEAGAIAHAVGAATIFANTATPVRFGHTTHPVVEVGAVSR
jgi:hypothetical protein